MNRNCRARTVWTVWIVLFLSVFATAPLLGQSSVAIEKATNGQDADFPPGPVVAVGSTVTWTYLVTNIGGRDLTAIAVTDDQGVTVSCPSTDLAAGTSMTCTAAGVAVAGQYANIGTVTATEVGGGPTTASDPSHYFGQLSAAVSLVKSTNGQDANVPPGPLVSVGSTVNWTYLVTNLDGSATLTGITVTDDQGVTVTCPGTTLPGGASMTCTAGGAAIAGQYANLGSVVATHPTLGTVAATDPSHYFGQIDAFDFGDAPDTYATAFAFDGARHLLGTGIYLGACVDSEIDGQPSAASLGDDGSIGSTTFGACTVPGDDEDGVSFTSAVTAGQATSLTVTATAPCTLSAWMDFDADGAFSTAESLFPGGSALAAGSNLLNVAIPAAATAGTTVARFRCTTDGVVAPNGGARDGEVEDYQVAIASSADLNVTKNDSPDPVNAGTNLTYTITAGNAGPSNAASANLTDAVPANTTFVSLTVAAGWTCTTPAAGSSGTITCSIASMPPGTASFTLVVAVAASTPAGTIVSNTATVSTTTTDPDSSNDNVTATTTVTAQADLAVSKSDAPDPVAPGANITYGINVSSTGPSIASTVNLSDTLPAGTTFVSLAAAPGWTCTTPAVGASGTIACSIASVSPGAAAFSLIVAVDASAAAGTILSNTATISSTTPDPDTTNNSVTATTAVGTAVADLGVSKTDSPDPVRPGANLTYAITVTNAGPSNATTVTLSDALPSGTTFVSLTAAAGWTCTTPAAGSPGTVSCSNPLITPSTASFSLMVAVGAAVIEGSTISNTTTVSSSTADPIAGNDAATATTLVGAPQADLSILKNDTPDPVTSGAHLTYTITVSNLGPNSASNLQLNDPLPVDTTFVSLTAPAAWTCTTPPSGSNGTVSCATASLAPGGIGAFTLTVAVVAGLPGGSSISNTATITSATADPSPANNSGTTTTTIQTAAIPSLSPGTLAALALLLATIGVLTMRRGGL